MRDSVSPIPIEIREKTARRLSPGQQSITGHVIVPFLQNLVAGFGAFGVSHIIMNAIAYRSLDYLMAGTPLRTVSLSIGFIVWCLLCLIRAAWDEFEALVITYASYAGDREEGKWQRKYEADIQVAINEYSKLQSENKRLRQQLNAQPKRQRSNPLASVTFDPSAPDPYAGDIGVDAFLKSDESTSQPLVDTDTEKDIDAANELLNHYAQHGSIGKSSAYDKSNMPATRWNRAINFMVLCGAVEKEGKINRLAVDIDRANVLIDRYVQARMKKRKLGVHVAP